MGSIGWPKHDDVSTLRKIISENVEIIETEDEVIRAWVDEQFDLYKERSTELTVDDLPR